MAEDLEILCEREKRSRGRAIAAGAVNYLKQWPVVGPIKGDIFNAILAGCLVTAAFVVLALVPAILALAPSKANGTCRLLRRTPFGSENENSTNIFFVKHENRTWTNDELCHIETAARHYPDYNIFMINLLDKKIFEEDNEYCESLDDYLLFKANNNNNNFKESIKNSLRTVSESTLLNPMNIINIDITIEKLFARSMVLKRIKEFNTDEIEIAAKFQIIWELPGIAIEPLNIHQIENMKHYFENKQMDAAASIGIDNDLQATSVPCQSFIGLVIREMTKSNFTDRQTLLKRVLETFCPSMTDCDGVKIIRSSLKVSVDFTACPTIYFKIMTNNDNLNEDFVSKSVND